MLLAVNLQAFLICGFTFTHECEKERFSLFRQVYLMIVSKESCPGKWWSHHPWRCSKNV